MMLNFEVFCSNDDFRGISKVYAIDTNRDRFLIVNACGDFLWADTKDCMIEREE